MKGRKKSIDTGARGQYENHPKKQRHTQKKRIIHKTETYEGGGRDLLWKKKK